MTELVSIHRYAMLVENSQVGHGKFLISDSSHNSHVNLQGRKGISSRTRPEC